MIQPWKPSPEVVGWLWDNFWARTHLIWRGIHRQNEFFSSCLDVFENSNFIFFWIHCVVPGSIWIRECHPSTPRQIFELSSDTYLSGFFYRKLLPTLKKKCLKISWTGMNSQFIPDFSRIRAGPLRVQNRRPLEGFLFFWDFELRKKLGGFYFSEIFGILAWVLLVNLSTFLTWFLLVNLTKNAQNFRRFAPNRAGVFIFIENLQNFGRGFLIEGGYF